MALVWPSFVALLERCVIREWSIISLFLSHVMFLCQLCNLLHASVYGVNIWLRESQSNNISVFSSQLRTFTSCIIIAPTISSPLWASRLLPWCSASGPKLRLYAPLRIPLLRPWYSFPIQLHGKTDVLRSRLIFQIDVTGPRSRLEVEASDHFRAIVAQRGSSRILIALLVITFRLEVHLVVVSWTQKNIIEKAS